MQGVTHDTFVYMYTVSPKNLV